VSVDPPVSRRVVRDWCRRQGRDPKTDRPSWWCPEWDLSVLAAGTGPGCRVGL